MAVTLLTVGTRGDVQPLVGLGVRLRQTGLEVRLATHARFEKFVTDNGLVFYPLEGDPQELWHHPDGEKFMESDSLKLLDLMARIMLPAVEKLTQQTLTACRGARAVVTSTNMPTGWHVAEHLNLPCLFAGFAPAWPTKSYPHLLFPSSKRNRPSLSNLLGYWTVEQYGWGLFRNEINRVRKSLLGLPSNPLWGPYRQIRQLKTPVMFACSSTVVPKAEDWPDYVSNTGFWFLEGSDDWVPPRRLTEFLDAGPPPIYFGFGSMGGRKPQRLAAAILEAVVRSGERCVVATGWAGQVDAPLPERVLCIEEAPHEWLLPKCSVAIHHGGSGTTGAALRAGIPSLVFPFFGDQSWWAQRLQELGCAPPPQQETSLQVDELAALLRVVAGPGAFREAARRVGVVIRREDGVGQAAILVEKALRSPGYRPKQSPLSGP